MIWAENPPAAVLVAKQFNPSIVSQIWLTRQGILDPEGRVEDGSIFSDTIVQALTPDFVLLVFMEQLQFILKAPPDQQKVLVEEKLGKLVRELPHIPYRAVGLNFNWHLTPAGEDIPTLTRRLFVIPGNPVFDRFRDGAAHFGT